MTESPFPFVPYHPVYLTEEETLQRVREFYQLMDKRRTVRDFAEKPVAKEVIEQLLLTASTAPSGAHKQPWTFCVVADPSLKKQIRAAAEKEEYDSYHGRMTPEWLEDLAPLGTDWQKPFLETAPYLIVVFKKAYDFRPDGTKRNNYYVSESVGIACGFLIAAIQQAGLVTLTHTPSPMNFLTKLLKRPENERPFLLLPVGYPADAVRVPDLKRKSLEEVSVWYDQKPC
ncbi:nitroreductase family protein [Pontibacter toksunensis]|uniref:Nitroreductase family protein n=1 Tax=Pontibacter toksunensis TaxID=1332631 RepID=A0ABW6BQZ4_9BACT